MIVSQGDFGTATTLGASGEATKLIWYPRKAAFRAGYAAGDEWDHSNIGSYSMALGYGVTASGLYSVAIGDSNTASGIKSVAIGSGSVAAGTSSTAMGRYAKADADRSFVWAGDVGCNTSDDSCDLDEENVFAIIGGLCVDDAGGVDCPAVGDGNISYDTGVDVAAYDIAEGFPTSKKLEKGDVVITVDNTTIGHTNKPFDSKVVGVISTSPNIVFNFDEESNNFSTIGGLSPDYKMPEDRAPLTLTGRIPVKTTNENGNIEIGDLLTTSSREGYAMKFTLRDPVDASDFDELKSILKENEERRNSVLGKTLEPCDQAECKIMTLLSLQ
jgi:hypothetical protein